MSKTNSYETLESNEILPVSAQFLFEIYFFDFPREVEMMLFEANIYIF